MRSDEQGTAVTIERELKLGVPEGFELPDPAALLPGCAVRAEPTLELDATYYDTEGLDLLRAGVSLRRRTGEGAPRWTLKLPAASPDGALVTRREVSVDDATPPAAEGGRPVPPALVARVAPWTGGHLLEPVAQLCTTRHRHLVIDPSGVTIELADDRVSGQAAGGVECTFRELEAEVLDAAGRSDDEVLDVVQRLGAGLRAHGAGAPDPTSKVARVLASRSGDG